MKAGHFIIRLSLFGSLYRQVGFILMGERPGKEREEEGREVSFSNEGVEVELSFPSLRSFNWKRRAPATIAPARLATSLLDPTGANALAVVPWETEERRREGGGAEGRKGGKVNVPR